MIELEAKKNEMNVLKTTLQKARENINTEFPEFMAENTSPELEALFYDENTRKDFYLEYEKQKLAYINKKYMPLVEQGKKLESELFDAEVTKQEQEAIAKITEAYPDFDFAVISRFYNEELTPKQKAEIDKLGNFEAYKAVYELSKQAGKEELPQELMGSSSNDMGDNSISPTDRF